MALSSFISLTAVLIIMFAVGCLIMTSRLPRLVKWITCLGLVFRIVGSIARYEVMFIFYHGMGDARGYYGKGVVIAEWFRHFNFSTLSMDLSSGKFIGTQFVRNVSAFVLVFIGPSMFTEFLVFSLFAFVGMVGFAVAFHRAYPTAPMHRYLIWIFLFPSLWYWPSSVGKEALIVMGLGIAVMGFVGRHGRIRWIPLILGTLLTFMVRPQTTGILLVSMILAQLLAFDGRWTPRRVMQCGMVLALGLVGVGYSMRQMGMDEFDVDGVTEYIETDAAQAQGSTSVEQVSGISGIPMAAINILFRPLPWEITNSMVALSSMEIMSLWAIVFWRRRNLMRSLRSWRSDRFLRLSLAFILIYSVGLGLMIVNIGIIARMRIFLFPFIFLLIEAEPRKAPAPARQRRVSYRMARNGPRVPRRPVRTR